MMIRNIKRLGRMACDAEGTLWLCSPASEIAFHVEDATQLSLTLRWNGTCPESTPDRIWPRYAVYLDGERIADARLNEPVREVPVFGGGQARRADVRLVKLSEGHLSLLGVQEIRTDGTLTPLPERKLKIEFIGDSITCGYGVEETGTDTFSTATENAEKSHAFLAAQALGADAQLTAFSGCGLISGYTDGEINEGNLMPPVYDRAGRIDWTLPGGLRPQDIPWDFSAFQPDYVVIQLGNNDLSWTRGIPEREALFVRTYEAFLRTVREHNPKARILCALGVFGDPLVDRAAEAVENRRRAGDGKLRFLRLPEMDEERYGSGADHHPSEAFQRVLADILSKAIFDWMKQLF